MAGFSGRWAHVAVVFPNGVPSAANTKIYIDGVPQALTQATGTPRNRTATSRMFLSGWGCTAGYKFGGTIDDVRIYNRELTVAEVGALAGMPVLWLKLDETSGTNAVDSSGLGHNGTLWNGPTWTANGQIGGALNFDGVNDYVTADNIGVNMTPGGCNTVAFWMKWNGVANNRRVFYWNTGYYNLVFANGYFGINTYNSDVLGVPSSGLAGQWVYVAVVFPNGVPSATSAKIYINGTPQTLQACGTPVSRTAKPNIVISGLDPADAYKFGGTIDDVRIYNRELTADEVEGLAEQ